MVDTNDINRLFLDNFAGLGSHSIGADGLVTVSGNCKLMVEFQELPIGFNQIKGNFDCSDSGLTSTKGFPKHVGGDFNCQRNKLTSCKGMPQRVGGSYICNYNKILSMEGLPPTIAENLQLRGNHISSLLGAPETIGNVFNLRENPITSLEGLPKKIGKRIILPWYKDLPVLRLLSLPDSIFATNESYDDPDKVEAILHKWRHAEGSLRSRIIGCQNELIANGFAENAKW